MTKLALKLLGNFGCISLLSPIFGDAAGTAVMILSTPNDGSAPKSGHKLVLDMSSIGHQDDGEHLFAGGGNGDVAVWRLPGNKVMKHDVFSTARCHKVGSANGDEVLPCQFPKTVLFQNYPLLDSG